MAKTKPNYLNGTLFGNFSSNPVDRFNYLFSNVVDVTYDYMLSNREQQFKAVCISGFNVNDNTGTAPGANVGKIFDRVVDGETIKHRMVKVKPLNRNFSILPNPIDYKGEDREFIYGMHEWAVSDEPVATMMTAPAYAQELECYYADGSSMGLPEKTLFYKAANLGAMFRSYMASVPEDNQSLKNGFDTTQAPAFLGPLSPELMAKPPAGAVKNLIFDLPSYYLLANALKDNILANIRHYESRNNPYIVNYGTKKGRPGIETFPQLQNMTLAQVSRFAQGTGTFEGTDFRRLNTVTNKYQTPFAMGLYQMIPDTIKEIIQKNGNYNPEVANLLFTPDNQHVFGTMLLFNKRPTIGSFLIGKHNKEIQAGQSLAREWAYAPLQYAEAGQQRGQSRYGGDGVNKHGTTPETIVRDLKAGRDAIELIKDQLVLYGGVPYNLAG